MTLIRARRITSLSLVAAVWLPLAALLAACSAGTGPTPKSSVMATEVSLTAADRLAMNYLALPRCSLTSAALCSKPATVTAIKAAGQKAYDAVVAAQAAVDAGSSATASDAATADATAAVAAFATLIPPAGATP
jgi:hypothetical protein